MPINDTLPDEIEAIAAQIVDAAFRVYTTLGPGLLESVYERCLTLELQSRSILVEQQVHVPIIYLGQKIDPGLRLDLLVGELVIVEVKAVEAIHPVFYSQLKTYLKLSGKRLGFLINFNSRLIKNGIERIIV